MGLRLIFDSRKTIRCQFISLVIRNTSLAKRFPGGQKAFLKKYSAISNADLTVYSWADDDFDDVVSELKSEGFTPDLDFSVVDVFDHEWSLMLRRENRGMRHGVNLNASWLAGRYVDGSIYVWAISSRGAGFPSRPVARGSVRAPASVQEIQP